jgi:hypothetical protein
VYKQDEPAGTWCLSRARSRSVFVIIEAVGALARRRCESFDDFVTAVRHIAATSME